MDILIRDLPGLTCRPNHVPCYTGGSRQVAPQPLSPRRHNYKYSKYLQFPTSRIHHRSASIAHRAVSEPSPTSWIAPSRSSFRISSRSRLRNFARIASLNCAASTIVSIFAISKNAASLSSEATMRSSFAVLAPARLDVRALRKRHRDHGHQGSGV
jgi:hypothetical protein